MEPFSKRSVINSKAGTGGWTTQSDEEWWRRRPALLYVSVQ